MCGIILQYHKTLILGYLILKTSYCCNPGVHGCLCRRSRLWCVCDVLQQKQDCNCSPCSITHFTNPHLCQMNKNLKIPSPSHQSFALGRLLPAAYRSTSQWYILPVYEDRLYFLYASQMMWYYSSQEWIGSATWISIKAGLWRWMRGEATRQTWPAILHRGSTLHRTVRIQSDESSFLDAGLSLLLLALEITSTLSPSEAA